MPPLSLVHSSKQQRCPRNHLAWVEKQKQAHGVVRPNEPKRSAVGRFVGSRSVSKYPKQGNASRANPAEGRRRFIVELSVAQSARTLSLGTLSVESRQIACGLQNYGETSHIR
jgi:hypothetical protein